MARVVILGPEDKTEVVLDVDEGQVFVVGREPHASAIPAACEVESRKVEFTEVPGTSVSHSHVVAWNDGGEVKIHDVSRNGTWALLPKNQTVPLGSEVVLQLARGLSGDAAVEDPGAPKWVTAAEYARSMADSIERWLIARGYDLHPTIVPRSDADFPTHMPLASGHTLEILPSGTTMDERWPRLLARLWNWVVRQNAVYENEEATRREGMILVSKGIRATHQSVVTVAEHGASTLLLTGPTGSGKERVAEVFHRHSGRSGPLVVVNCAIVDKQLLRQELFGSEKGSFTDGTRRVVGAVERAQGGTLFLDEIGEIPLETQGILLRFLENREISTIGRWGVKIIADVRVVAATNKVLQNEVRERKFREDLWFRLAVHRVEVPPLKERWEDIAFYLRAQRDENGRSIYDALSPAAIELLRAYDWTGNFRELRGFADRLLAGRLSESISEGTCRRELQRSSLGPLPSPKAPEVVSGDWTSALRQSVDAFVQDRGREPANWTEQREWNERYLKPIVFYFMSGASAHPAPTNEDALRALANKLAGRMDADRATAFTQLQRYFQIVTSANGPEERDRNPP